MTDEKPKKGIIHMRIDEALKERARKLGESLFIDLSAVTSIALVEFIERKEAERRKANPPPRAA